MRPEALGEGYYSHQHGRDCVRRRWHTHLPDEPFFVQSQLAQMRQAVRRASEAWLLARIGRMNWQENGTAGAEKGIDRICDPIERKFTLSRFARSPFSLR